MVGNLFLASYLLYLPHQAEGLKRQHQAELTAEIKAINKTVNEMREYVKRTIEEVQPIALEMALKEFLRLATNTTFTSSSSSSKRGRFSCRFCDP